MKIKTSRIINQRSTKVLKKKCENHASATYRATVSSDSILLARAEAPSTILSSVQISKISAVVNAIYTP